MFGIPGQGQLVDQRFDEGQFVIFRHAFTEAEQMRHPFRLGAQVTQVFAMVADFDGNPLRDLDTMLPEFLHLMRVIGNQPDGPDAKVTQDAGGNAVIALIGLMTEMDIGLHRIHPLILEIVGLHLFNQADAAPLLPQVNEDAGVDTPQVLQGMSELIPAIAATRTEDIAGQAFGVHPDRNAGLMPRITLDQGEVLLAVLRVKIEGEIPEARG